MTRVGELSEGQILKRIVPILPTGDYTGLGSGDDAAVVAAPGGNFVVTTDVLVEGVHFRTDWSTGFEVGARAAAQNLADIAAMAARPTALVVSLVLPPQLEMSWVEDLAAGLSAVVFPTGAGVVGGDLSRGEQIVVSVTAHGRLGGPPVTRAGASTGDTLAVVGSLGYSAAGYAALDSGAVSPALHGVDVPYPFTKPLEVYRMPHPPLAAGPLAAQRGATAMMDISDGLVVDARRMAEASGVAIDISRYGLQHDASELSEAAAALGADPYDWILYGAEDHGLLVTFPPYVLVTEPFRTIGTVGAFDPTRSAAGERVTMEGRPLGKGWDHFHSSLG